MLTKILQNIGLTSKEAQVYLANLEVGLAPVSTIALRAKMNRVTSYDILEKLIQKGLVSFVTKDKIKYFCATDPELVVNDFQSKTKALEQALPDLKRLHGDTTHPRVHYYEGVEGIKRIYADTLTSQTEILNYCNSQEIRNFWPGYDEEYVKERAKRKIYLRGIAPHDHYGQEVQSQDQESYREIRLVSKEQFNFTNEINIYENKVAIISCKSELIGMIIESPEIANTQRSIFKMVWEFADTSSKEKPLLNPHGAAEAELKIGGIKKVPKKEPIHEAQESLF